MKEKTVFRKNNADLEPRQLTIVFLIAFVACYVLCAIFFQIASSEPPWNERSPIEFFTRGLLWMLSLTCMLIASHDTSSRFKIIFWMMSCAALFVLAIDERFAFHERPERLGLFNDDYFKVILWFGTALVFRHIFHLTNPSHMVRCALIIGYLFHSLYILVEIGDGDFFRLPFVSSHSLKWSEELFELFFLSSYLISFVLIHLSNRNHRNKRDSAL